MGLNYNPEVGLLIADIGNITCSVIMLLFEIIIIIRFLIPLRVKSPYILIFYLILGIMLLSNIVELGTRIYNGDPGFLMN